MAPNPSIVLSGRFDYKFRWLSEVGRPWTTDQPAEIFIEIANLSYLLLSMRF